MPRAAQTIASAMPVLPLVGSTTTVSSLISPSAAAASSMASPMRSLTDPPGLKNSSLARTVAPAPSVIRLSRTSGVFPIKTCHIISDSHGGILSSTNMAPDPQGGQEPYPIGDTGLRKGRGQARWLIRIRLPNGSRNAQSRTP